MSFAQVVILFFFRNHSLLHQPGDSFQVEVEICWIYWMEVASQVGSRRTNGDTMDGFTLFRCDFFWNMCKTLIEWLTRIIFLFRWSCWHVVPWKLNGCLRMILIRIWQDVLVSKFAEGLKWLKPGAVALHSHTHPKNKYIYISIYI